MHVAARAFLLAEGLGDQAGSRHGPGLHSLNLGEALGTDRVETITSLHRGVSLVVESLRDVLEAEEVGVALVASDLDGASSRRRELLDAGNGSRWIDTHLLGPDIVHGYSRPFPRFKLIGGSI